MFSEDVLQGRRALITGGGRGIGRAIAEGLAAAGAEVAVTARTSSQLDAVVDAIRDHGGKAHAIKADLSDPAVPDRLVSSAIQEMGDVDILINNAGHLAPWKRAEDVTEADWEGTLQVNLVAPHLLAKAAVNHLEANQGSVVNIASIAGLEGTERMLPYSVTKAGLIQLTKDLAREWAPRNIRVNAIAPGWVETQMTQGLRDNTHLHDQLKGTIPLARMGTPDEIAQLAVFLCTPAAAYITGATYVVDGGESV